MDKVTYNGVEYRVGDEVYWNDPDSGLCSDYFYIDEFFDYNIVGLTNSKGSYTEAFLYELD